VLYQYVVPTAQIRQKRMEDSLIHDLVTGIQYYNGKWTIYNQDLSSPMQYNLDFNIVVPQSSNLVFTLKTNMTNNSSFSAINHPALNGHPNAKLFISHNLTQSINVMETKVSVYYSPFLLKWCIITSDLSVMPDGMAFSVMIPDGDLDGYPDYSDRCYGYDDAIDRDQDGDPDYCESFGFSDFCDYSKTMVEDHLPGEILRYAAEHSITSDRKINTGAQITFETRNHYLEPGFEVVQGATFDSKHADCLSGS